MVRDRAGGKSITLSVTFDAGVDEVVADALRLRQVILNLLTNAVKFTPEGGRVDAGATRVGDEIRVSVADSGIGIAEADQALIFDAFQQARRGASAAEGTGLGLTLSRRIVELHGGRLWVKSRVGEGSTFTFALPAPRPAASEAAWPES
jgi:signal transduction histidine kinase